MTGGSELVISAQNALTPTNTSILEHTSYGSTSNIKPIKVGSELLFVQRGAERIRTLLYDYSIDSLTSNELSVLASHIAEDHGVFLAPQLVEESTVGAAGTKCRGTADDHIAVGFDHLGPLAGQCHPDTVWGQLAQAWENILPNAVNAHGLDFSFENRIIFFKDINLLNLICKFSDELFRQWL